MEELRDAFVRETDLEKQKKIAEQVQIRAMEVVTHANVGQWYSPTAWRKDRIEGCLEGPAPYFWNISKK
jgi:peptide/nickel transport system substrate-binding protein